MNEDDNNSWSEPQQQHFVDLTLPPPIQEVDGEPASPAVVEPPVTDLPPAPAPDYPPTPTPEPTMPDEAFVGRTVWYTPSDYEPFALRGGDPGIVGSILRVENNRANIYLLCDGVEQNTTFTHPVVRGVPYNANGEGGSFRFTR